MVIHNYFWNKDISYFYYKVIDHLKFKDQYDFVFISKLYPYNGPNVKSAWPELKHTLIQNGRPVILFLADDEYYSFGNEYIIPGITQKIFKHYVYFEYKDHPVIRPIPLPVNTRFKQFINWECKIFDYSFMGTNNYSRNILKESLEQRKDDGYVKFLFFNEEYNPKNKWIDRSRIFDQYSNILSNTKLSFCPPGWRNNECYRTVEAAAAGCIILASELLPHWYNVPSPYIKIDDWTNMSIIDTILSKPEKELKDISHETRKWYENYLSPKAVAQYITNELSTL
jgi:hypothetical protein